MLPARLPSTSAGDRERPDEHRSKLHLLGRAPAHNALRLIRIDLTTDTVDVVRWKIAAGDVQTASVAIGADAELVVAASRARPHVTELERWRIREDDAEIVDSIVRRGEELGGPVVATAWGVHYLDHRGSTLEPRDVPYTAFQRACR